VRSEVLAKRRLLLGCVPVPRVGRCAEEEGADSEDPGGHRGDPPATAFACTDPRRGGTPTELVEVLEVPGVNSAAVIAGFVKLGAAAGEAGTDRGSIGTP